MQPVSAKTDTARQASKFGLVGVLNTALDFSLFSVFRLLGVPLIVANLLSTTAGMAFSFFANRTFVFSGDSGSWKRQALLFFPGTAFAMYGLQTLTIVFLVRVFPRPLDAAEWLAATLGVRSASGLLLARANAAKLAATAVSLTWNYCFYRWAVFAPGSPDANVADPP